MSTQPWAPVVVFFTAMSITMIMLSVSRSDRTSAGSVRINVRIRSQVLDTGFLQSTKRPDSVVRNEIKTTQLSVVPLFKDSPHVSDKQLKALLQNRAGVYVQDKPKWTQRTVLVTASNWNYRQVLFNWQCHAARHGFDYIVISMDPKIHEYLGSDRSTLCKGKHVEADAGRFRSPEFNTITCNKLLAVRDILLTGLDVVFSDPDNVLVADPFKDKGFGSLGEMIKSGLYDFIYSLNFMSDDRAAEERSLLEAGNAPFFYKRKTMGNTGFYWMRSTAGMIALVNQTVEECIITPGLDDQTLLWERVLRRIDAKQYEDPHYFGAHHCTKAEWEARQSQELKSREGRPYLRYCNLDMDKYVTGRNVTWPGLVAYHSNFASGFAAKKTKLVDWTPAVGSLWIIESNGSCKAQRGGEKPERNRNSAKMTRDEQKGLALVAPASVMKKKSYEGMEVDPELMLLQIKSSCSSRGKGSYLTFFVGDAHKIAYGSNNQLVALTNMIHRAMRENRTLVWPEVLGPPESSQHGGGRFLAYIRARFDLTELFTTFCIVESLPTVANPNDLDVLKYQPLAAFYDHVSYFDKKGYNTFSALVIQSIFGNPQGEIVSAIQRIEKKTLGVRYVAVHLRNLNPIKAKYLGRVRAMGEHVMEDLRQQYVMNPAYVDEWRKKLHFDDMTVFIGSDNQRPELTKALKDKLGAKQINTSDCPDLREDSSTIKFANAEQLRGLDSAMIDFLLMMRSSLFLGNDASTVSWSVVKQRRIRGVFLDNVHGPLQ